MSINKDLLKEQLLILGFTPVDGEVNVYSRKLIFNNKVVDTVTVDFNAKSTGQINWGNPKTVGRLTSSDLSKPEYMVQLYWYIRLVESGYSPENIAIEQPVQLGHKDGFIDLVVFTPDDKPFMALDAKNYGTEANKYTKALKASQGQVASYYRFSTNLEYIGVISAKIEHNSVEPSSYIVSTTQWKKYGSPEEYTKTLENNLTLPNVFRIAPNAVPYNEKNYLLKPTDLIDLNEDTASQMFHGFLTILRKHGISDKTNAFNKVLNLFIAKIVDEFNTPDDKALSFQNYMGGENEPLETLYTRIENLYSQGLRDFIKIYIDTDKDINKIKQILNIEGINDESELVHRIEHLLSKVNADFQFKDVYDNQTYIDNLNILKELVDLIAPYKLKYAKKQQFLGDFFESILSNGFKQEAGQFFTPVPLAHFIVSSLPLPQRTKTIISDESSRQLLPRMIDFACGSGHFITEYMDEMQKIIETTDLKQLSKKQQQNFKQFKDNPFAWSNHYVYGLDIDYRLVKTSKVSSFLNGDGDAIIRRANGLASFSTSDYSEALHSENHEKMNQVFDILIANPPYHVDEFKSELPNLEEDFELGKLITNNSSEIEALFIERASQLLKTDGLMGIILPSAILDTENNIYVEARKMLLKRFEIVAIMKNPNKATFSATKVETVTIFGKRRNDDNVLKIEKQIRKALNNGPVNDITLNHRENCISTYIDHVFGKEFTLQDYTNLLAGKYEGEDTIVDNYKKEYKRLKDSKISFSDYIKNKEIENILFYVLTDNKSIIIQTPTNSMSESLQLLGYKFSDRRGQEGIHSRFKNYSIEDSTLLYGTKDKYLDYLVKNAFLNKFEDNNINDSLKPFYRIKKLNELIAFKAKVKSYKIMLAKALTGNITDYGNEKTIPLHKIAILKNGTSITSSKIKHGNIPVIAGGREPAYYHNEENRSEPTITVSQSGAYAGFVSYHDKPIFASDCFTITAKPNSGYSTLDLYYLLKKKQKQIYSFATGSIQKHVYAKDMEDFKIPDKGQELQVVNNLIASFESEVQRQRQLENELTELQQSLFSDIDKVYKNSQKVDQSISMLEDNELVKVMGGKRIPKEYDRAPFSTCHYYPGVKDFENFTINLKTSDCIDDVVFEKIKRYVLKENDVFVSAAGTIGKVGMAPKVKGGTISLTENAHRIRVIDQTKLIPRFLMYILKSQSIQDAMNSLVTKTGTPKLSIESLKNIEIPILKITEQQELIKKWDQLNTKINDIYSQIN